MQLSNDQLKLKDKAAEGLRFNLCVSVASRSTNLANTHGI